MRTVFVPLLGKNWNFREEKWKYILNQIINWIIVAYLKTFFNHADNWREGNSLLKSASQWTVGSLECLAAAFSSSENLNQFRMTTVAASWTNQFTILIESNRDAKDKMIELTKRMKQKEEDAKKKMKRRRRKKQIRTRFLFGSSS